MNCDGIWFRHVTYVRIVHPVLHQFALPLLLHIWSFDRPNGDNLNLSSWPSVTNDGTDPGSFEEEFPEDPESDPQHAISEQYGAGTIRLLLGLCHLHLHDYLHYTHCAHSCPPNELHKLYDWTCLFVHSYFSPRLNCTEPTYTLEQKSWNWASQMRSCLTCCQITSIWTCTCPAPFSVSAVLD